jgi:hypothetical protein
MSGTTITLTRFGGEPLILPIESLWTEVEIRSEKNSDGDTEERLVSRVRSLTWPPGRDASIPVTESREEINAKIKAALEREEEYRARQEKYWADTWSYREQRMEHERTQSGALNDIAKALKPKSKTTRETCNEADERKARIAAYEALAKIAKNGISTYGQNRGHG